jgi:hypothetical protein
LDPNDLSAMSGKHSPDFSQASSFQKSKIMMRMGLIVVSVSALTVMELGTPSPTKTNAPDPIDQLTVDVSVAPDTLEAADRIEIYHLLDEASPQPASPVEPAALPADVTMTTLVSRDSSTVGLDANDRMDVVKKLKPKPKYTGHPDKPRPKRTNANKAPKLKPSKVVVEVKPCGPNALDSLLHAVKLSLRCQT